MDIKTLNKLLKMNPIKEYGGIRLIEEYGGIRLRIPCYFTGRSRSFPIMQIEPKESFFTTDVEYDFIHIVEIIDNEFFVTLQPYVGCCGDYKFVRDAGVIKYITVDSCEERGKALNWFYGEDKLKEFFQLRINVIYKDKIGVHIDNISIAQFIEMTDTPLQQVIDVYLEDSGHNEFSDYIESCCSDKTPGKMFSMNHTSDLHCLISMASDGMKKRILKTVKELMNVNEKD